MTYKGNRFYKIIYNSYTVEGKRNSECKQMFFDSRYRIVNRMELVDFIDENEISLNKNELIHIFYYILYSFFD